jgi:hypothetical protein
VHRFWPGPVLQYRPSRFQTAGVFRPRAARQRVEPPLFRPRQLPSAAGAACHCCHACSTCPPCNRFTRHAQELAPFFIPPPLYPAQSRTTATESTTAPLRSVTLTLSQPPRCPPTCQTAPPTAPPAGHRLLPSARAAASASTRTAASGLPPS